MGPLIVFTSRVLSGISCALLPTEDTMPIQSFSVGLICIMKSNQNAFYVNSGSIARDR